MREIVGFELEIKNGQLSLVTLGENGAMVVTSAESVEVEFGLILKLVGSIIQGMEAAYESSQGQNIISRGNEIN